jgi:DNA polymerase epsilon subunit 4
VPYKEIKEKKAGPSNSAMINGDSSIEVGQTTLDGKKGVLNGTNGFGSQGPADPNAQLEMEIRGANRKSVGSPSGVNGIGGEDVEMH